MFDIGEKVVCIDDSAPSADMVGWFSDRLYYRRVYVVRAIWPGRVPGVSLVGITGYTFEDGFEVAFESTRFRRLAVVQAENVQLRQAGLAPHVTPHRESFWAQSQMASLQEVMKTVGARSRREFEKVARERKLVPCAPGFYAKSAVNRAFPHREVLRR